MGLKLRVWIIARGVRSTIIDTIVLKKRYVTIFYNVTIHSYIYLHVLDACNKLFFTQNAIFCILFALALLAGGIANAIHAADNSELWRDTCFFVFGFDGDEFCENLERVRDAEIASVVSESIHGI